LITLRDCFESYDCPELPIMALLLSTNSLILNSLCLTLG
jgi:hypothetical protein